MSRKIMIALLIVLLLAAAAWMPAEQPDVRAVVHQHQSYPAEDPGWSGLDEAGVLSTHLPIVILHADGAEIPGIDPANTEDLYCDYSILSAADGHVRSDDVPVQHGRMAISIRGNSSRTFAKKQYSIRLVDERQMPQDRALLDLPPESSWVLNGSYIDRAIIRNYLLYNLCSEFMDGYAPRCRLCEVMITDADGVPRYQGVYTLMEKIKVSESRLNLEPYDPQYPQTSFLLQMNAQTDKLMLRHLKPDSVYAYPFDLEYPDVEELTPEALHYINVRLLGFEKALYDASFTGNWEQLEERINLDSFVDYYLVNEFFQNYDAGTRSTYIYEDLGGKIAIGPVWDFDGTFNNFFHMDIHSDLMEMRYTLFYTYLVQNPRFMQRCIERYQQLRQSWFSDEYLLRYIDESAAYLGSAATRNSERWYHNGRESFDEDIQKMKDFVISRGEWMDSTFGQFSRIPF